jgi:hypothetical protein
MDKKTENQLDMADYIEEAPEHEQIRDLGDLSDIEKKLLHMAGIDVNSRERLGSFLQKDHSVVHCSSGSDGAEILSTSAALEKYDGLEKYWWKAVGKTKDKYTSRVDSHRPEGYFIRSFKGANVRYPLQACLYMSEDRLAQDVHNIVVAEEGSTLNIISGCVSGPEVHSGLHVGITEYYVEKGATLIFTMVHNWAEDMAVRPRSAAVVEDGAKFISNYICLKPAKDLQMYPTAVLDGKDSVATFNSILMAAPGSRMDVGSRVILRGEGSRGDILSRAVSTGGQIIARGHLLGETPGLKAHLECQGLIMEEKGLIHAIPELEARTEDLEMSHEAAVGKIDQAEIEYLMARGLTEEEATSLIVKGFLSLDIPGLPEDLRKELDEMVEKTGNAM